MGLADLDDLLNACRNPKSRETLAEAVSCYRAGAYRACVVTTWIAVTFDYLSKLRDLGIGGNKEAERLVAQFETARQNHDLATSLRLERELVETATTKFELLTPIESLDMKRLFDDRNRCAHPSLISTDEPYHPSAELARTHLRSAVTHLLSQRPIQGKEAWTRIWTSVSSELFPGDTTSATRRLKAELERARPALVRRLVIALVKSIVSERPPEFGSTLRKLAALDAVIGLHHSESLEALEAKLDPIVASCDDSDLIYPVRLIASSPICWGCLGDSQRDRLCQFVRLNDDPYVVNLGCQVPGLVDAASDRIRRYSDEELGRLAANTVLESPFIDDAVTRFASADFKRIMFLRDGFLRGASRHAVWNVDQLSGLIAAFSSNPKVLKYWGFDTMVKETLALAGDQNMRLRGVWRELYRKLDTVEDDAAVKVASEHIRSVFVDFAEAGSNGPPPR